MIFLFTIGKVSEHTDSDLVIWLSGLIVAGLIAYGIWGNFKKPRSVGLRTEKKSSPNQIPWYETEGRPYRFIFTHAEEALDSIEAAVSAHPKVEQVFQDSGYWYSNGETGPEWYSMHVICQEEDGEELQEFVRQQLKARGFMSTDVRFTGSYN
jgi:hypothetical protein